MESPNNKILGLNRKLALEVEDAIGDILMDAAAFDDGGGARQDCSLGVAVAGRLLLLAVALPGTYGTVVYCSR